MNMTCEQPAGVGPMAYEVEDVRRAAPAPARRDPALDECWAKVATRGHLHLLSERWSAWVETRRYFAPPPLGDSLIGKLGRPRRAVFDRQAVAECSPELQAFHLAILSQPDDTSRRVFLLHYLYRVRNIKRAATELGIGRASWYRLLREFQERCYAGAGAIMKEWVSLPQNWGDESTDLSQKCLAGTRQISAGFGETLSPKIGPV